MQSIFSEKLVQVRFNLLPWPLRLVDMLTWLVELWAADAQLEAYEVDAPTAPLEHLRVAVIAVSNHIHQLWARR